MSESEMETQSEGPIRSEGMGDRDQRSSSEKSRLDEIENRLIAKAADPLYRDSIWREAESRLRSLCNWRTYFSLMSYLALACAGALGGLAIAAFAGVALVDFSLLWLILATGSLLIAFMLARYFSAALDRAARDVGDAADRLKPIGENLSRLMEKGMERPRDAAPLAG